MNDDTDDEVMSVYLNPLVPVKCTGLSASSATIPKVSRKFYCQYISTRL